MKRYLILSGALALFIAMCAPGASAQVPGGSYQQTCRNIGMNGNTLYASCKDRDGHWHDTQLSDIQSCSDQVINDDGNLRCDRNGNGNYYGNGQYGDRDRDRDRDRDHGRYNNGQYGYGYGTYTDTCRDIRQNGNRIDATCQKKDGGWRNTSLDNADQCGGQIVNIDGHLRCGGTGGNNNGYYNYPNGQYNNGYGSPGGTYVETCRDIRNSGDRIDATCQKRDGGWRRTSLDNASQCRSQIINDNGRLRCNR
jgi:hypothetical protein